MRIVSGFLGGRQIEIPDSLPVRPTMDITRDSFFNILNSHYNFDNLNFLDLFSGTGLMSYEAASRGFKTITAVDNNYRCCRFIRSQFLDLGIQNAEIICSDSLKFLRSIHFQYHIIFADPPYQYRHFSEIVSLVFDRQLLHREGLLAIEHGIGIDFSKHQNFKRLKKYGQSLISFFSHT